MPRTNRASWWYLLLWGTGLLVLGVGSLIVHPDFSTGAHVTSKEFLGAETNGWHGVAGLSLGLLALAFVRPSVVPRAPAIALVIAIVGGIVPAIVFAFVGDGGVAIDLIPVDLTDAIVLHLVPGLIGCACAAFDLTRARAGSTSNSG